MRYLLVIMVLVAPFRSTAQPMPGAEPVVSIDPGTVETIIGQPATVRIRVLVPTFMPAPPVFPSLEEENLLVRLPERASGPISETVDGQTWAGVQRSLRLYPLAEGSFGLDGAQVQVTFVDPQTNTPAQTKVDLPPFTLAASLPEPARGLNPVVIARGFTLQQDLTGAQDLKVGGTVSRIVTARIEGTTPLLIPALIDASESGPFTSYPKDPQISETEERGILSGERIEHVTYVAQSGGQTELPEISVDWFNLDTGQIETARVAAVPLSVAAQPWRVTNPETALKAALAFLVVFGGLMAAGRILRRRLATALRHRRDSFRASVPYARRALLRAIRARDLSATYSALETLKARSGGTLDTQALEQCLMRIGAGRCGPTALTDDWRTVRSLARQLAVPTAEPRATLPPLNPFVDKI